MIQKNYFCPHTRNILDGGHFVFSMLEDVKLIFEKLFEKLIEHVSLRFTFRLIFIFRRMRKIKIEIQILKEIE